MLGAWLRLVRAPAALTVLGDTTAGAAATGNPLRGRRLLLPLSSVACYWAGMALNDWADRALDTVERPERPIPSGAIGARAALVAGAGLGAAGLGLAAAGGGRRAMALGAALNAAIWGYDTRLKSTVAGPVAMALCRVLDVLIGAPGAARAALPGALTVGTHTLGVTLLSRGEVHGGSRVGGRAAIACTLLTTAALGAKPRGRTPRGSRTAAALFGLGYLATVGGAQLAATRTPSADRVRAATVAGIHGTMLLQAALAARGGAPGGAAAVAGVLPVARMLSRGNSPT